VHVDYLNVQDQQRNWWPASFAVARAYLDQLARSNGLGTDRIATGRNTLARAERASGKARKDALTQLASRLTADAASAGDQKKVLALAAAVTDLANAKR